MVKTTTASIELIQNQSIILEKAKAKSFFKTQYILENSLAMMHLLPNNKLPLIIDLSKLKTVSCLGLYSLLNQKRKYIKNSFAIVIPSRIKFLLFKFLQFILPYNSNNFKVCNSREEAIEWINQINYN